MRLPQKTRVYRNHHLDSERWRVWKPRAGDVIVTTSYKSGTTFTQEILTYMLYGHLDPVPGYGKVCPWPDARFHPITVDQLAGWMEGIRERRFFKSHLALDGLRYDERVKYIVVGRDPRDVFMSLLNHYRNYTELAYDELDGGDRVGAPMPRFVDDVRELWRNWMTRGWFPWESEGWPFWGNMHHTKTYWEYRELPNLLLLHYNEMRTDHARAVRRVAEFIEHPVSADDVQRIVEATTFEAAKKRAVEQDEATKGQPRQFAGGEAAFIYKGTNGRWREILGPEDLEIYEAAKERVLPPDAARWLENGSTSDGRGRD